MSQFLFTVGETKPVTFAVEGDDIVEPTSVTATIRDTTTLTAVISAAPGGAAVVRAGAEYEVYYGWTPVTEGKYSGALSYTLDDQVEFRPFTATVLPASSKYPRWIELIQRLAQEHATGGDTALLTWDDYMAAADIAVGEYSRGNTRREVAKTVSLTAGVWAYTLAGLAAGASPAAAWVEGVSEILSPIEYPYDATLQTQSKVGQESYYVDERAAEWRFRYASPSAGESARVRWATVHTLSHTVDTVPDQDRPRVARYAAGECLSFLGTRSIHTDAPQIAAEFAQGFQARQGQYASQGAALKKEAKREWRRTVWSF